MYKAFIYLFSAALLAFCLMGCEGRRTSNQALKKELLEYKDKISFEKITYIPENYIEHKIDTTFKDGLKVGLKYFTDMTSSVLYTQIKDTINYQTYYRNYEFEISIYQNGNTIFKELFNKNRFNKEFKLAELSNLNKNLEYFEENAVLHSIGVNQELSSKRFVIIDLLYKIPQKSSTAHFVIKIDELGNTNYSFVKLI